MNNKEYSGSLIFDTYEKDFIDNEIYQVLECLL